MCNYFKILYSDKKISRNVNQNLRVSKPKPSIWKTPTGYNNLGLDTEIYFHKVEYSYETK